MSVDCPRWLSGYPAEGYDVQVRLLDEAGNIVYSEQRPLRVSRPASESVDSAVADVHIIPGDPHRPPGNYTVQISLEGADDRRLQLVGGDGRWLDDKLRLSAVRVTD